MCQLQTGGPKAPPALLTACVAKAWLVTRWALQLLLLQVCSRLGLVSLGYLWHQPQDRLLQDMIASDIEAVLVKVREEAHTQHTGRWRHHSMHAWSRLHASALYR